jgi:hypothetical protein
MNNQLNINFGTIPNIQTINPNQGLLNRMITSLIENDNILSETINLDQHNNNGTSGEFINNLEEIDITDEIIEKHGECSICLESFKIGDKCIRLPCKDNPHYFHANNENCPGIKSWLETNNTCPLCRTEFPTENISQESNLIPNFTSSIILTPDQINGLNNTNNILQENIINNVDNFIRNVNSELIIQDELQRTIELSLTDY